MLKCWVGFVLCILVVASCRQDATKPIIEPLLFVPEGFPEPSFPSDNQLTPARFALGKKLFYDVALSRDSSVSCASCHHAAYAFSDTVAFSPGVGLAPGQRNSPTLANVAYHPYYLREGGVPTLEMQILVPVQEHNEFDFNILLIAERLKTDSAYVRMSLEAYDREPDPFVITRSIACFERCLISGQSRYDQFIAGQTDALSAAEVRGMDLFFSDKTNCANCHGGFNFTNYAFENNGLYSEYADPGRYRLTFIENDRARFKVPSLRNIARTAPYMHDGSQQSIESVLAHYNSGGVVHPNKSALIKPLSLSNQEIRDIAAFLRSLTDEHFINNDKFR